ncbi:DNA-binding transcriptional LysR family regulator [Motilibacter peucedani]|uniref:DNA-binding transcriptional LysR family regulator n=1 Tax=Motilibacter peucedani TaxID=598650 RepID=A0A420XL79_9ACTN|nr:LysR family transcriptional regulator [Motilibacter peucedani]RKS69392.1 DNA-binding transcriptional LysR family regulator [Motilibacter peucedani]
MLDMHRLRVLHSVVEAGSVTAAAASLNYTPSAVSQHLAALEREAGIALMERSGRGIRPTPAGTLLAQRAGSLLEQLQATEKALADLRTGRSGRVVVAAFPTAGTGLVPAAVERFRREAPGVELELQVAEAEPALAALRDGSVDVAVALLPSTASDDGLHREHLLDDPFRVVLPRTHRLAGRRTIALADLADDPWIGATACTDYCGGEAIAACRAAGFTQRVVVEADDYPAVLSYVGLGVGVALVPLLALGACPPGTVVRRIRGQEPVRRIHAVTRPALAGAGPVPVMLAGLRASASSQAALR